LKDAAEYFDKLLLDRYGVSAQLSSTSITVTDLDGSATVKRKLQGIKVSGPIKIDQIPGTIAPSGAQWRNSQTSDINQQGEVTKSPWLLLRRVKKIT
jgi:hypothetical protein